MKIGVDGGALCSKEKFGNFIVTKNFIEAINLYDPSNEYYLYSFCDKPQWLKTNKNIHYLQLAFKTFWLNFRVSIEEIFDKKDIFLALNQAIPLYVSGKIISFCHGLSYYFYPQYYPDSFQKLKSQLEAMVKKSSYILVSSQKVKEELISIYRYIEEKVKVIPFGIPFDMDNKSKVKSQKLKVIDRYFLFVGMNHPIKNIKLIKKAYEEFKKEREFTDFKLYLVTKNVSREKLRQLYQGATALLTASFYESFNLPVIEALACGCPVIGLQSAIIPELSSYVYTARNFEEFLEKMKKIAKTPKKTIDRKRLREQFSWKRYVKRLQKLY